MIFFSQMCQQKFLQQDFCDKKLEERQSIGFYEHYSMFGVHMSIVCVCAYILTHTHKYVKFDQIISLTVSTFGKKTNHYPQMYTTNVEGNQLVVQML